VPTPAALALLLLALVFFHLLPLLLLLALGLMDTLPLRCLVRTAGTTVQGSGFV